MLRGLNVNLNVIRTFAGTLRTQSLAHTLLYSIDIWELDLYYLWQKSQTSYTWLPRALEDDLLKFSGVLRTRRSCSSLLEAPSLLRRDMTALIIHCRPRDWRHVFFQPQFPLSNHEPPMIIFSDISALTLNKTGLSTNIWHHVIRSACENKKDHVRISRENLSDEFSCTVNWGSTITRTRLESGLDWTGMES